MPLNDRILLDLTTRVGAGVHLECIPRVTHAEINSEVTHDVGSNQEGEMGSNTRLRRRVPRRIMIGMAPIIMAAVAGAATIAFSGTPNASALPGVKHDLTGALPSQAAGTASCRSYISKFSSDNRLPDRWLTNTPFLSSLAASQGNQWVSPRLKFSSLGMTMAGVDGAYEFTGIQSKRACRGPFTFTTSVKGTKSNGNAFWVELVSGDTSQVISVRGNLNPSNTPYYGIWVNWTGQPGGPPSYGDDLVSKPSTGVVYTIAITVSESGHASVRVSDLHGKLGVTSGLPVGTDQLYQVLGQYEGAAHTVGPNVAVWRTAGLSS